MISYYQIGRGWRQERPAEQRVILAIKVAGSLVKSVSKESIIGDTKNTAIRPSNLRDAFEKLKLINIYYKNEDE